MLVQGYGTLEATQISWLSREDHLLPQLLTTVGRPVSGVDVRIRKEDGTAADFGASGEIWVRGPAVMNNYYNQPEETAKVMADGWFRTGDVGVLDAAGYLSIVGRTKDLIVTTDGHVYSAAIEDVLLDHSDIREATVFSVVDSDACEHVCAAVVPVPSSDLTSADARSWVSERRGSAYTPELLFFLDEIPTVGSQKPNYSALRRLGAELLRSAADEPSAGQRRQFRSGPRGAGCIEGANR
ncbi:class I adenylate-forming enzyme family protein [Amycolatopsis sp. NPDC059090]|uniref:class I adenylate-forming enzyme family protein n=1 Tax=unclassified Amycolatopsis TaxID=2618356 RepID=UPI00367290E7